MDCCLAVRSGRYCGARVWPLVRGFADSSPGGKAMAQNVTVMLIDDLDQSSPATETVRFGVDRTAYEIDLSAEHADQLRRLVGRYVAAARRARPAPRRERRPQPRVRTQLDQEQSRRIRSWALERGLLASPRGRIPQQVAEAYEAAMRAGSVPFRSPGSARPKSASDGQARRKVSSRRGAARGDRDHPVAAESAAGPPSRTSPQPAVSGLTPRELAELKTIADTGKPGQNLVAGRLRSRGLVDRDTSGHWRLSKAGKHALPAHA